jgi:hypothetical protein
MDSFSDRSADERTIRTDPVPPGQMMGFISWALAKNRRRLRFSAWAFAIYRRFAPGEGETVADLFYREEPHPQAPRQQPDAYGLIWMPEEGFQKRLCPECFGRCEGDYGRRATADCAPMHSRASTRTRVEIKTLLVPDRERRPHDQPEDTALHGGADGSQGSGSVSPIILRYSRRPKQ